MSRLGPLSDVRCKANQRDVIDLLLWPDMASVTFEESDRCFESVRITSL